MKPFNPKQTIEEIEEFIKDEENIGNIENTLYVDIESKTSKEFQQPDVKRKSKYDEDEKLNKISTTIHDKDEKKIILLQEIGHRKIRKENYQIQYESMKIQ